MEEDKPIFVRIDEYKDVLDVISLIKNKLSDAKRVLGELQQLKNTEDAELEQWQNRILEVEKKIEYIDGTLFKPQ